MRFTTKRDAILFRTVNGLQLVDLFVVDIAVTEGVGILQFYFWYVVFLGQFDYLLLVVSYEVKLVSLLLSFEQDRKMTSFYLLNHV